MKCDKRENLQLSGIIELSNIGAENSISDKSHLYWKRYHIQVYIGEQVHSQNCACLHVSVYATTTVSVVLYFLHRNKN